MTEEKEKSVGEMKKRRVTMEDGKRYLIYYTFENGEKLVDSELGKTEENENV